MKFSIGPETLKRGLNAAGAAISLSISPVLSNVRIEALDDGTLQVSATNLEIGVTCVVPADVKRAGATTIPARMLTAFVDQLPAGDILMVDVSEKTHVAALSYGRNKANFHGISAGEFPELPTFDPDSIAFSMPAGDLRAMVNQVVFAATSDTRRAALAGIETRSGPDAFSLAATDGFRLSRRRVARSTGGDVASLIIPARTFALVAKLCQLSDSGNAAAMSLKPDQVVFRILGNGQDFGHIDVTSVVIAGKYPEYDAVIPATTSTTVTAATRDLLRAVRVAQLFANFQTGRCFVHAAPGSLTVYTPDGELGGNSTAIDAEVSGADITVALHAQFLTEAVGAIDAPSVRLGFTSPNRPITVRPDNDTDYLQIIMPVWSQE